MQNMLRTTFAAASIFCIGAWAQSAAKIPAKAIALHDAQGTATFSGAGINGPSGSPALPQYTLTFLLPPNTDPKDVTVQLAGVTEEIVSGAFDVSPIPARIGQNTESWPAGSRIVQGRDQNIYGQDAFWPASHMGAVRFGRLGAYQLVEVQVSDYQYNPVSRQLRRVVDGNVLVKVRAAGTATKAAAATSAAQAAANQRMASQLKDLVVNYDQAMPAYATSPAAMAASVEPGQATTYLIVSTDAIRNGSSKLGAFADSKMQFGFRVELVTENAAYYRVGGQWACQTSACDGGWGGGRGDAAAESLRGWLKSNYVDHRVEYGLLVGNPNPDTGDVPMKMTWPRYNETSDRNSPTDFYFAELTGNWDLNGDGVYGQEGVDDGTGGVDHFCEIAVGRIPFYGSFADLDKILAKTIRYQNETDISWRANVLFSSSLMFYPYSNYYTGEVLKDSILDPLKWGTFRIYDSTYGVNPEMVPTTEANVLSAWRSHDFGVHAWQTHGGPEGASNIFSSPNAVYLDDLHPSFTMQASCNTSYPEDSLNLAYALLRNGGIATIGATRVSWLWTNDPNPTPVGNDGSYATLVLKYSNSMVRDVLPVGKALNLWRATTSGWLMNLEDFNVYGDPSLSLGNVVPVAPKAPTGLTAVPSDHTVTLSWTAPSNAISYTVFRSTSPTGPFTLVATNLKDTSFVDFALVNNTTYYFVVTATDPTGDSPNSSTVSATPSAPPSGLHLQYKVGDYSATDNQIKPFFNVVNTGTRTESLAGMKIRYWFTSDNAAGLQAWCDWAQVGASNLSLATSAWTPAATGADRYLEIGFGNNVPALAPGAASGEIQARMAHSDWSNFNEIGDYSYDPTKTTYAMFDRVALYSATGVLVSGIEPGIVVPPTQCTDANSVSLGNANSQVDVTVNGTACVVVPATSLPTTWNPAHLSLQFAPESGMQLQGTVAQGTDMTTLGGWSQTWVRPFPSPRASQYFKITTNGNRQYRLSWWASN